MSKLIAVPAMLAACLVVAVGCGGGNSGSGTAGEQGSSQKAAGGEQAAASGPKVKLDKKTVGIVNVTAQSITSTSVQTNAQAAAKALGWDTRVIDGAGDPAKMAQGVQSLVNQGVDAIITITVDPAVAKQQLEAAKAKGIPTIQVGAQISDEKSYAASYEENDWAMSSLLTKQMASIIGHSGDVAVFNSDIVTPFVVRVSARDTVLKLYPDIHVVASPEALLTDPARDAQEKCNRLAVGNKSLKAIWTLIDAQFGPCLEGVRSAGRADNLPVFGWYALPDQVSALRKNKAGSAVVHAWLQEGAWTAIDQLASHFARGTAISQAALSGQPLNAMYTINNIPAKDEQPAPPIPYEATYRAKWKAQYDVGG